jgi:hypothetical protein
VDGAVRTKQVQVQNLRARSCCGCQCGAHQGEALLGAAGDGGRGRWRPG